MNDKPVWDVFISHASEDKKSIVAPLEKALERQGVRTWVDKNEIFLGDSLRNQIDRGLSKSKFGVVIISPEFLKKDWTAKELDALLSRETRSDKVILPIWHNCDEEFIRENFPLIHGKLAMNTSVGIVKIATAISSVVKNSLTHELSFPDVIDINLTPDNTDLEISYTIQAKKTENVDLKPFEKQARRLWIEVNDLIVLFSDSNDAKALSKPVIGSHFFANDPDNQGRHMLEISMRSVGWGYGESDILNEGFEIVISFEDNYNFEYSLSSSNSFRIFVIPNSILKNENEYENEEFIPIISQLT